MGAAANRIRLLTSGPPAEALARRFPPACAQVAPLPAWESDGADGLRLVLPLASDFLADAERLVPSLSSLIGGEYAFRFGLRPAGADPAAAWTRLTRIGRAPGAKDPLPADVTDAGAAIGTDVDTFRLRAPSAGAELEVQVWTAAPDEFRRAPCLLALSAAGGETAPATSAPGADVGPLPVPALSQMLEAEAIRMRICSPTSVAMVLGALGMPVTVAAMAAEAHCPAHERYGVWPANVWAASRHGALGAVVSLDRWDCARALLAGGLPLVISEAHDPGALPGSPLPETDGHLLVLRGLRGDRALVNDPAAPSADAVPMEYEIGAFGRAWLGHGGIAYVLAAPEGRR